MFERSEKTSNSEHPAGFYNLLMQLSKDVKLKKIVKKSRETSSKGSTSALQETQRKEKTQIDPQLALYHEVDLRVALSQSPKRR